MGGGNRGKSVLAIAAALCFALTVGVLLWPGDAPTSPPPPEEPAPTEIEVAPVPAAPAVAEPPPPAPEPAPATSLLISARGGELPRTLQVSVDGETRVLKFPPWADPQERRVPLPGVDAGAEVEVSAEGFAPGVAVVAEPRLEVRVELGAHASILVTSGVTATQPMKIVLRGEEGEQEAELALPGQVEIGGLVAGPYLVEVHGGSKLPLLRREITLKWGERQDLSIAAGDLGLRVAGRTVTENGDAVVGVEVGFKAHGLPEGFLFAETAVTSDRRGRFVVFLPPGLVFEMSAVKKGYGRVGPLKLELGTEAPEDLTIELLRGRGIRGIVVDPAGAPVVGALVICSHPPDPGQSGNHPSGQVTTGEDGRFRFDEFAFGKLVTIRVRMEGYAIGLAPPLEVGPETRDVRIVVLPVVPVEVHFVEAGSRKPIDAQRLAAFTVRHRDDRRRTMVVHATKRIGYGRWVVRDHDGESTLLLNPVGMKDHVPVWHEVQPVAGESVILEFAPRGGVAVTGRVIDEQGRPVKMALVLARNWEFRRGRPGGLDRTDSAGRFRLTGLEPGERYVVTAKVERDLSGAIVASSGPVWIRPEEGSTLEIRVCRTGAFRAAITPEDPGLPVSGIGLSCVAIRFSTGETPEPSPGRSMGMSPGLVKRDGLRPGRYDFVVSSGSHLPLFLRDVVITAGETTDLGNLVLKEGSTAELTLVRSDGTPVAKCWVCAMGANGRLCAFRQTDESGRVRIDPLPAEPIAFIARGPGVPLVLVARVDPKPRSRFEVKGVVPVAGQLRIRTVDQRGRLVTGRAVEIRADAPSPLDRVLVSGWSGKDWWPGRRPDPVWAEQDYRTGPDGTLLLDPIAPGRYLVTVGSAERSVTVASGEIADVSLVVQ